MLKLKRVLGGASDRMLVGNPAQYTMRADDPRILTGADPPRLREDRRRL